MLLFCKQPFYKQQQTEIGKKNKQKGIIYVCGIFVEHYHEIFPVHSEKVPNELPGNIPK